MCDNTFPASGENGWTGDDCEIRTPLLTLVNSLFCVSRSGVATGGACAHLLTLRT